MKQFESWGEIAARVGGRRILRNLMYDYETLGIINPNYADMDWEDICLNYYTPEHSQIIAVQRLTDITERLVKVIARSLPNNYVDTPEPVRDLTFTEDPLKLHG